MYLITVVHSSWVSVVEVVLLTYSLHHCHGVQDYWSPIDLIVLLWHVSSFASVFGCHIIFVSFSVKTLLAFASSYKNTNECHKGHKGGNTYSSSVTDSGTSGLVMLSFHTVEKTKKVLMIRLYILCFLEVKLCLEDVSSIVIDSFHLIPHSFTNSLIMCLTSL